MPKRYLVTGCSGFLGSHLAEFLVKNGGRVFGTYHRRKIRLNGATMLRCDFKNRTDVEKVMRKSRPHVIFHLAGQSNINHSWQHFEETFQTNISGTYYLLEALRKFKPKSRVIVAGSSSEYGATNKRIKLSETSPLRPSNPYALSKVGEDLLGQVYSRAYHLPVLRVLPFYVMGPRKEPDAPSDFAKSIIAYKLGKVKELRVGNLKAVRDVVDFRDAVKALNVLAERGKVGESYNLCTGKETSLKKILSQMLKISGSRIKVRTDRSKFRVGDETRVIGNPAKLEKLGWRPQHSVDETLKSILDYWETPHPTLSPKGRGQR